MIHVLINTLAEKMNEFLSSYYERAEIIVEVLMRLQMRINRIKSYFLS